jgi:hypothetical protein
MAVNGCHPPARSSVLTFGVKSDLSSLSFREWTMWNDRLDARLLKLKRDGLSFAEIAERMGVTRNAALGRFQRLNRRVFPSQAERYRARKEATRLKAEARARKDGEIVRKMKAAIAAGADTTKAISQAFAAGGHRQRIGDVFGLSRQRVYQIATGAAKKRRIMRP